MAIIKKSIEVSKTYLNQTKNILEYLHNIMSKMLIAQMLKKIFKYYLMNKMKLFYSKYSFHEDFGRLVVNKIKLRFT